MRSDRGGEYESPFEQFCAENGIIHQTTAPYSPQQNGVAERKNRTLKDMITAMLLTSGLPTNLWGEALNMSNHILNKVPHNKTGTFHMSYGKDTNQVLNTSKCGGACQKFQFRLPRESIIFGQPKIVVSTDSWYSSLI